MPNGRFGLNISYHYLVFMSQYFCNFAVDNNY